MSFPDTFLYNRHPAFTSKERYPGVSFDPPGCPPSSRAWLWALRRRRFSRRAAASRSRRSDCFSPGDFGLSLIPPLYRGSIPDAVDILSADGIVRRALTCRRSSGVERTLGKGEVVSSILTGGTSFPYEIYKARAPRLGPACERGFI